MAWALDKNLIFMEHETLQPKMCCSEARPKKWWLDLWGLFAHQVSLLEHHKWGCDSSRTFFPAPRWSMQCRIKEKSLPTTQSGWKDFWRNIPIFLCFFSWNKLHTCCCCKKLSRSSNSCLWLRRNWRIIIFSIVLKYA